MLARLQMAEQEKARLEPTRVFSTADEWESLELPNHALKHRSFFVLKLG
jgi:hypothetical protein